MQRDTLTLTRNADVPNNPRLPVRLYRAPHGAALDARAFECRFAAHGWPPDWRGGVYDFHHFHSTAHEVLGIARGQARLLLGGPDGTVVDLQAGDALLLPAGTGHCCLQASDDFQVVGAYPDGQDWDLCRAPADAAACARIDAVPDPVRDPMTGNPF
ncbi:MULTISPECIES: cupin [Luteimonas]|uniref:cupin n=1 Tax=Luteimonas TaxID=83614 RepID=UPI000C79F4C8|nr:MULTISPECIES: cupin [Luteimonas]